MSTDRELLEMAAKAAGIVGDWDEDPFDPEYGHNHKPAIKTRGYPTWWWNPLNDDGDALRLAVKLHITPTWKWYVDRSVCEAWSYHLDDSHGCISVEEPLGDDEGQATRLAIVRAAAELGRRMP